MKTKIRLLDVFAGIGGFHIGVKQACKELGLDFECVGAIEFNKQAQVTYAANFPTTPLLGMNTGGDITKMDLNQLPQHNLLCGGFPCQPFSRARHNRDTAAGIHAITHDDRADLFTYLCTILKIHQPRYLFFENVPGLLKEIYQDGIKVIDHIIACIQKCGYDTQYYVINASDCRAPQARERVIILGKLKKLHGLNCSFMCKDYQCICDILDSNVDNHYLLQNLWANIPNRILPGTRYEAILKAYNSGKWDKPTHKQKRVITSARVEGDTPSGCSRQRDRVFNSLGLSPTIICSTPISISIDKKQVLRQLTPRECARIQCFPDCFQIPKEDSLCYTQIGNAVCVNMVNKVTQQLLQ